MTLRLRSIAGSLGSALLVGACALAQDTSRPPQQTGGASTIVAQTEPAGNEGEIALFDEPADAAFNACAPEVETQFQGCTTLMAFHRNATVRSCYCASNVTPVPQSSPLPIPNGRRNVVAFGSAAFIKFDDAGQGGGDPCEQRTVNGRPTTVCW